jgi:hypothetical protein
LGYGSLWLASDSIFSKTCLIAPMDDARTRRLSNDLLETRPMKKLLTATVALVALGATVPALAADLGARGP